MYNKARTSFLLCLMLLGAFTFQSCKEKTTDDGNQPTQSITTYLSSSGGYTAFIDALDQSGIGAKLSGSGQYTILAVTDLQLEDDGIDLAAMSAKELSDFMNYHFFSTKKLPTDFSDNSYVKSESSGGPNNEKLSIYTQREGSSVRFNGHTAFNNFEATNGMVYELTGSLEPLSVLGHIATNPNLENYDQGVKLDADIKTALGTGSNTVFAINEDDLVAYLKTKGQIRIKDISTSDRKEILNNTMVYGKALNNSQLTGTISTEGEDIIATTGASGVVFNGDIKVLKSDINCTDGIIHIIDGVIK